MLVETLAIDFAALQNIQSNLYRAWWFLVWTELGVSSIRLKQQQQQQQQHALEPSNVHGTFSFAKESLCWHLPYISYLLKDTAGYSLNEVGSQNIVIQEKRRREEACGKGKGIRGASTPMCTSTLYWPHLGWIFCMYVLLKLRF